MSGKSSSTSKLTKGDYQRLIAILEEEYSDFNELFRLFDHFTSALISKMLTKVIDITAKGHKENLKKYMEFWLALFFGCLDYFHLIQHGKFLRLAFDHNAARFARVDVGDASKLGSYTRTT